MSPDATPDEAPDALRGGSLEGTKEMDSAVPPAADAEGRHEDPKQPPQDQSPRGAPLHGVRLGAVVLGVCLGSLMMSLDITIIATVRPARRGLNVGE